MRISLIRDLVRRFGKSGGPVLDVSAASNPEVKPLLLLGHYTKYLRGNKDSGALGQSMEGFVEV